MYIGGSYDQTKTIFNVTPKQIEEFFNKFVETYPNGYKRSKKVVK